MNSPTISRRDRIWLDSAQEAASHSRHWKSRVGAVIVKGKIGVGWGYNSEKTHPHIKSHYKGMAAGIHAELAALINSSNMRRGDRLSGATIYVARIFKDGSLAPSSKPCPGCMRLLVLFGISTVVYYDRGKPAKLKIKGGNIPPHKRIYG